MPRDEERLQLMYEVKDIDGLHVGPVVRFTGSKSYELWNEDMQAQLKAL